MFLIYFLVFTFIFTVFENIALAGIFLVLVLIGLVIYQSISRKKILSRQLLFSLFAAFLVAGVAFGVKERNYSLNPSKIEGLVNYSSSISFGSKGGSNNFVGTGMVSDLIRQGRYVFVYQGDEFVLVSEKKYVIGDVIRLMGNSNEGRVTPLKTLRSGQASDEGRITKYIHIHKETFAVPVFSGSFDYGKWMKMKGWQGTIYETNSLSLRSQDTGPRSQIGIIQSMKKSIQEKVIEAYGENRVSGLILGMLIGDRSQIPKDEYQQFIDSGLVHLIAVSGGNILMIVVFLQFALFRVPFYLRTFIILVTIVVYSFICGMDSSVFRAMVMGGLSMVALFRGREINVWRLMSMSAIVLLVINPYFLVYDVGFLLSYAALVGLICFSDKTTKRGNEEAKVCEQTNPPSFPPFSRGALAKIVGYVYKNYISPSVGASVGIFPVIMFFMGRMNLMGIVGNLFVLPIVPFVMIYGFISVYLYQFFGWSRLLWIEKILVEYMYIVADLLSQYGLYISVSGLRLKYVLLLGGIGWLARWRLTSPHLSKKLERSV